MAQSSFEVSPSNSARMFGTWRLQSAQHMGFTAVVRHTSPQHLLLREVCFCSAQTKFILALYANGRAPDSSSIDPHELFCGNRRGLCLQLIHESSPTEDGSSQHVVFFRKVNIHVHQSRVVQTDSRFIISSVTNDTLYSRQ